MTAKKRSMKSALTGIVVLSAMLALTLGGAALSVQAQGDEDSQTEAGLGAMIHTPGLTRSTSAAAGLQPFDRVPETPGSNGSDGIAPVPACQAVLPSILAGSTVNVSLADFDLRLLTGGYLLRNINIYAEGPCQPDNRAPTGNIVVDTGWYDAFDEVDVNVTQRISEERQPNLISPYNGQVWVNGYLMTVSVNSYAIYYGEKPPAAINYGELSPSAGGTAEPAPVAPRAGTSGQFVPPVPADYSEAIRSVLAQLAPEVDPVCYYEQRRGDWADLGAMGIGDPRRALPDGFVEQFLDITAYIAPPASCDAPSFPAPASFYASFAEGPAEEVASSWIGVGAYAGGDAKSPGYIDDGSAYWSNGTYQFSVSAYDETGPLGRGVVTEVAIAMDPEFTAACVVESREVTQGELAGFGVVAPEPPAGFAITRFSAAVTEPTGSCADGNPSVVLKAYWSMEGGGSVIEVGATREGDQSIPSDPGYISDGSISWLGPDGTRHWVYAYTAAGGVFPQETLVSVAMSVDPTLDVDSLSPAPDPPGPKPLGG